MGTGPTSLENTAGQASPATQLTPPVKRFLTVEKREQPGDTTNRRGAWLQLKIGTRHRGRRPSRPAAAYFFFFVTFFFAVLAAGCFSVFLPKTLPHCSVNFLLGPDRTIGPGIVVVLLR